MLKGQLILLKEVQEGMGGPLYRKRRNIRPECYHGREFAI